MENIFKSILAFFCTVCGFAFGDADGMLIALIVLDYILGVIAAIVEKKLSSAIGEGHVLKTVTVVFYIANE